MSQLHTQSVFIVALNNTCINDAQSQSGDRVTPSCMGVRDTVKPVFSLALYFANFASLASSRK